MLAENGMKHLSCGGVGHPTMDKLMESGDPRGPLGRVAFSLWICQQCGVMALHLETPGDIYWYKPTAHKPTTIDTAQVLRSHKAGCAYCSTRFDCSCDFPGQRHMCPRCDALAEESKMAGEFPTPDAGEVAQDRAASGPRYPEDLTPAETGPARYERVFTP